MNINYWRDKLAKKEKDIYDKMVVTFSKYGERISCRNISPSSINKTYLAVINDHPELYHVPSTFRMTQSISILGAKTDLELHNLFDRSQICSYNIVLEKIKKELYPKIYNCKNDWEKEKVICDYIIENTTYKVDNTYNQNAATVLVNKRGQCSGIARAIKWLLDWAGINAIVVNGYAKDTSTGKVDSHAWNIVQIDGNVYHLDVTFMLGANAQKAQPYKLVYFNYTDDEIKSTHQWDASTTPACVRYFRNESVYQNKRSVVCTTAEMCQLIEHAFLNQKNDVKFEVGINFPPDQLFVIIQECCRSVTNKLGISRYIRINIQNALVRIRW